MVNFLLMKKGNEDDGYVREREDVGIEREYNKIKRKYIFFYFNMSNNKN